MTKKVNTEAENRKARFKAAVEHSFKKFGTAYKNLAEGCAHLDPKTEQAMADDGLSDELKNQPKY